MLVFCYVSKTIVKELEMTRHDKQFNFRVAHENLEWLKEQAEKNRRSLTAQMNWIIEEMQRKQNKEQQAA